MREKEPERKLAQAVKAIGGGRALVSNPFRGKRVAQPKAKVNGFKKKAFQSPFGGSGLRNKIKTRLWRFNIGFNPLSGEAGCATNSTLMFAAETCVVKVDAMSMRGDVYDKYKDYCHRNNYKPVTQANFNNEVQKFREAPPALKPALKPAGFKTRRPTSFGFSMKAHPFGRRVWRGMAYIGDND